MVGSVFSVNAGISCTPQADTFGVFLIAAYYLLIQLLHRSWKVIQSRACMFQFFANKTRFMPSSAKHRSRRSSL
jgi:hypothetical protein